MGHTEASPVPERFVVTPEGEQWLENNPDFIDLLDRFYVSTSEGENQFRGLPHVGMGQNSIVRRAGDLAIKIATPSTGRDSYKYAGDIKPENLFNQFAFLSELGQHLKDTEISVPRQYFALSGSNGYVRAEQYMDGWQSLGSLFRSSEYTLSEQRCITDRAKGRVLSALTGKAIRLSLDFGFNAHCENLLIPNSASNPEMAPICVIDQPSRTFAKNIVAGFMSKRLDMQYGRLSVGQALKIAA